MQQTITIFGSNDQLINQLKNYQPVSWFNNEITDFETALPYTDLTQYDVENAAARLQRFAPYFESAFPETRITQGTHHSRSVGVTSSGYSTYAESAWDSA
ncbi:hypothetical protein [Parendozoicomonas sp. Alg238-R29]|uniref:hypothetical protein n=1 Tax=Parendozoicomonas sp. Alg238-R29 TaxID=2993446 RepID=UPI00248EAEA5|nr:hypothetical protein [Parendozoicomonas sp. Alg238-R29]